MPNVDLNYCWILAVIQMKATNLVRGLKSQQFIKELTNSFLFSRDHK